MIVTIFTAIGLILLGAWLSRKPVVNIPILVNGLIPSIPNAQSKKENGTTVYIIYLDDETEGKEIYRGYADVNGKVEAYISATNVGRKVMIRARHAPYKQSEFTMTVPEQGIVHTVQMQPDGVYNGQIRGADIGDLDQHYTDSLEFAAAKREQFIRDRIIKSGHPFARIPTRFWIFAYLTALIAFAFDYWLHADLLSVGNFDSFWHAIYFSAVTITTLGYGEITPAHDLLRIAVSVEAVIGVLFIGFALNSLFNGPDKE